MCDGRSEGEDLEMCLRGALSSDGCQGRERLEWIGLEKSKFLGLRPGLHLKGVSRGGKGSR